MTRGRVSLFALALSCISFNAQAQLSETIEVRVANIDVVVTDRAGQPVHDLTRDDFEVYENGKLQPITNFSEIRSVAKTETAASAPAATAAAVPQVPRTLIVFFDNSSIDPFRRNQVIDSVKKTLDLLLRPGDEAMIATWNQHFEALQPFTSDRAAFHTSLETLRKYNASASSINAQKAIVISEVRGYIQAARGPRALQDAYNSALSTGRAYEEFVRQTELRLMRSLTQTVGMLSGVEGKKVLMYVGGELERNPGLDVMQQIDMMFAGRVPTQMPAQVREAGMNVDAEIAKVARSANANGVILYMFDPSDRGSDASESGPPSAEIEFTKESNTYLSMAFLASETGGSVLSGSRNFEGALRNVARDLDSYYSIGYKPVAGAADRRITVKVKRPGLVARSRRDFVLRSAEEQTTDHVIANAFHSSMSGDFPVQIAVEKTEPGDRGTFRVALTLTFPSTLTYLPDGQSEAAEYSVYFVTTTRDGATSPVGKQTQAVKIPAAQLEAVKQKPFTHSTALMVRGGEQTISVAVFDRYGARTGYARTTIIAR